MFSDPIEKYQQLLSTPHPPKCAQEFFKIRKCAKILPPKRPNSVENDTEKIKTKLRKILSQDESSRNARISAYDTQANKQKSLQNVSCYLHCCEWSIKPMVKKMVKKRKGERRAVKRNAPTNAIKINAHEPMTQPPQA